MKRKWLLGLVLVMMVLGGCRFRDRRLVMTEDVEDSTALATAYPTNEPKATITAIPTKTASAAVEEEEPITEGQPTETDIPQPTEEAATEPVEVPTGDDYWPTEGWRTASPTEMGMNAGQLAVMFDAIDSSSMVIDSVVVVKDGFIVAERYYNGYAENTLHIQNSVTKSFISALVGIALEEGAIESVDQTMVSFFPDAVIENDSPEKQAITLENVLTMRAGLDWVEGYPAYIELAIANNAVEYMLGLPMASDPGTDFNYCSGCSHLLSNLLTVTTGMNTAEYAEEKLFGPLGITTYEWESLNDDMNGGGWGLYLKPRDMAKLGYLYLHNGEWDGVQVVPAQWVADSTAPGLTAYWRVDYGYQWWIMPYDNLYAAQGLNGQKIYVMPEDDLVVVMTADMESDGSLYTLLMDYILPAVED